MPYLDIWMYNSRPRMRVFLCYFLIFVTFFVFSDIMIDCYTKALYKPMQDYQIQTISPHVTVNLAEASYANGNIKGTIKNNTKETMVDQYLKFEFYTQRDVNVGVKYLKVGTLYSEQEKNYELGFRYDNVASVKIDVIGEDEVGKTTPEALEVNPVIGPVVLIKGILWLYL